VHDTVVAMDIQGATVIVNVVAGGTGSTIVTFPRPFAAPPIVMVSANAAATDTVQVTVDTVTATSCRVSLKSPSVFGWTCRWLAYGPRA
jgi:hypothetical protein